ncbi:MAG: T9SS type A sorting domain-containing protein [Bacteroidota bacterium]|jgi:hypothetical protein|nr:T9SS type A sorting domain-containing protein [Bacteroidota bacterium]
MRNSATLLAIVIAISWSTPLTAQIISADNIIIRVRPVCNEGQGGALLAAVEMKPRTNMWAPNFGRIGGFSIVFTYTAAKLVLQGVGQRYETGYWGSPYRSQAFGSSAWFNQHAHSGNPNSALPVSDQYFTPALDCQGQPLNDGFFELMYYQMTIGATVNGTVNLGLYDVQAYQTFPYQQNVNHTAIFNAELTLNNNDSTEQVIDLLIPVELSAFNVTARPDGSMLLTWRTETETSNLGFEVERGDGEHFERVGFVAGHGTTTDAHDYTWVDPEPTAARADNLVYYRLKQIDTDGTSAYSAAQPGELLPATFGLGQSYPNPASVGTDISIPYTLAVPATVHLAVYNTMGQLVATLADGMERQSGRHVAKWNVQSASAALPAGVYFVRFAAEFGGERVSDMRQISILR